MSVLPTVLIVDDNANEIDEVVDLLKDNYLTIVSDCAISAMESARDEAPDLILIALGGPELDGHDLCRELKEDPLTHDIGVIFVRTPEEDPDEALAFKVGGCDFVNRPLNGTTVRARVKTQIQLQQAHQEMRRLTTLDRLTKTANRRTFLDQLEASWRRCTRTNEPVSLLLLDLDHFKAFNDIYGYEKGDECVVAVARVLLSHMKRVDDLVARYRGDRFACLLPQTDDDGAKVMAENLLRAVRNLAIPHSGAQAEEVVTLSVGLATELPAAALAQDLFVSAEWALSEAKRLGRNQVHYSVDPSEKQLAVFRKKAESI